MILALVSLVLSQAAAKAEQAAPPTLALENGNRTRAARRLGISTRTIQRHLSAVEL